MALGPDIAELRKRAGLSAREVALRADVGASALLEIERGDRDPRWSTVEKIVEACGGSIVFYGQANTPASITRAEA